MGKTPHVKHHYIPQCYLRKFSDNVKSIHTYDKISSKKYSASIGNVCIIDNFYRLSEKYITENPEDEGKELFIECEYFSKNIEVKYSKVLNRIISSKDEILASKNKIFELSFDEKREIAAQIVIQFLRLPDIRADAIETFNDTMPDMVELFKQGLSIEKNNPDFLDLDIKADCDPVLLHANMTFMNDDFVNEFSEALANNYWSFIVSENGTFYTSDFPIVVEPHVKNDRSMYLGLAEYGSELTFPISKDIVLIIWDKEYFVNKKDSDCRFVLVDAKEERRQNLLRYFYAKRHVFSYHNDFHQIEFAKIIFGGKHIFKKFKPK